MDGKREAMNCECDYDYDYETQRYHRCNKRSVLCPEHDMCDMCDEFKAVQILDGDKLCEACIATLRPCPNCGQMQTFTYHEATSRESHGETFEDTWLTCDHCGARTDESELSISSAMPRQESTGCPYRTESILPKR